MLDKKEELKLQAMLDQPFEGVGKAGSALSLFQKIYYNGDCQQWPKYWSTFADQAMADLRTMRAESIELREEMAKLKAERT